MQRLREAAALAAQYGLHVAAGHGLTYRNITEVAAIPEITEFNIGHNVGKFYRIRDVGRFVLIIAVSGGLGFIQFVWNRNIHTGVGHEFFHIRRAFLLRGQAFQPFDWIYVFIVAQFSRGETFQ